MKLLMCFIALTLLFGGLIGGTLLGYKLTHKSPLYKTDYYIEQLPDCIVISDGIKTDTINVVELPKYIR